MHETQAENYVTVAGKRVHITENLPGVIGTLDDENDRNKIERELINLAEACGVTIELTAAADKAAGYVDLIKAILNNKALNTAAIALDAVTDNELNSAALNQALIDILALQAALDTGSINVKLVGDVDGGEVTATWVKANGSTTFGAPSMGITTLTPGTITFDFVGGLPADLDFKHSARQKPVSIQEDPGGFGDIRAGYINTDATGSWRISMVDTNGVEQETFAAATYAIYGVNIAAEIN